MDQNNYWAGDLAGLLIEKEEEQQVAIPEIGAADIEGNLDVIVDACENDLLLQMEEVAHLTASYLQQTMLADADQEIGILIL